MASSSTSTAHPIPTIAYPLDTKVLELVPRNKRRTQIVKLARSLPPQEQTALVSELCKPRTRGSPATGNVESQSSSTLNNKPKKVDDLEPLIGADEQLDDPTASYHLQELGLLVAASVARKEKILEFCRAKQNRLVSEKALALAVHATCVSDEDIKSLYATASERDKRKIVRACAREALRENLTNDFLVDWLKQADDRRVIACEILHCAKVGTAWLGDTIREIILRGRVGALSSTTADSKKKFAIDNLCYKALRRDLLWKRHGDLLIQLMSTDLNRSTGILRKAEIFDFWSTLLDCNSWTMPGTKKASAQRLANATSFVQWKSIWSLYADHIPFMPSSSSVQTVWQQKQYQGIVTDKVSEDLLASMARLSEWDQSWAQYFKLVVPGWMSASYSIRCVTSEDLFSIVVDKLFDKSRGTIKQEFNSLADSLLRSTINRLRTQVSRDLFAAILSTSKSVLNAITPAIFYSGQMSEEFYASKTEHLLVGQVCETKRIFFSFIKSLLAHPKVSTGQQLELFLELYSFSKKLLLRPEDFANPLQLITPTKIKSLLGTYQELLNQFTEAILTSLATRMRLAAERGHSVDQVSKVFSKIVEMGVTGVQADVERMYTALAKAFPSVFGVVPVQQVCDSIQPRLLRFSRNRPFEESTDVAAQLVNDLFLKTVLPMVRRDTFGEDALFSDRPGRLLAASRIHAQDVQVRAQALESMEPIRLQWFTSICNISSAFYKGVLSTEATDALLDFLDDWIKISREAVQKALDTKRSNKFSTSGLSRHPEATPNAERSLSRVATFLNDFIEQRCAMYWKDAWKDSKQATQIRLIQRAFRLWSAASFPTDKNDPCANEGPFRLDPYQLEPWLRLVCKLPDDAQAPFKTIVHTLFGLRLNGKIQVAPNNITPAPITNYRKRRDKESQPWDDAAELFKSVFDRAKRIQTSQEVLAFLEQLETDQRASESFLKLLDKYLDISLPHNRKRLEQDLTRPLSTDRLACMSTLLEATSRTRSAQEFLRTFMRIAKAIENETHENRMAVLEKVIGTFNRDVTELILPSATGDGDAKDRLFAQFLLTPPKDDDWPAILDAAEKLPSVLFKFLDDLLDSTDEKSDSNLKLFRSLSDEIFRRALSWPCSLVTTADDRIQTVQTIWFDCAMEIQWRLTIFRSGKAQASNTFRPMLSGTTISKVRTVILESGFQCDKAFPKGQAEVKAFDAEATIRRRDKARFLVRLFEDAYSVRIGEPPAKGTPLGRKPAMEKKRLLDLVGLVQGEWIHVPSIAERVSDVINQVSLPETTRNHQNQVHDIVKALTEASVTWGVKCRDSRPAWADAIVKMEAIVREKRRGGASAGGPKKKFGRLGKGGKNTAPVNMDEEDAPWTSARYFRYIPDVIARYWRLSLDMFGIHHPAGVAAGRAILRMHLRWHFYLADSSKTRGERQTLRCETALQLLSMCPSAVYIRVVQAVLKDFRQDLLEEHVFARDPFDPLLGKFSPMSPEEADDEGADDDDDDDDNDLDGAESKLIRPFRLGGVYGYEKLTAMQGSRLAEFLSRDVANPELSTVERVRAANKLTFIPAFGYVDFAHLLAEHFARKIAYAEAVRMKKKEGKEIMVDPPLPEAVVETLFRAVLSDNNPLALFSLLSTSMIRQSSTKTTILVAQRAVLLMEPRRVVEMVRILLARKGRDGLLIGPAKAFLRILFNFASQNEAIVGREVIEKCLSILELQWERPDLHQDARAVMVSYSLKALSHALSPLNEAFAWKILEDLARNLRFSTALRAILLSAEPASSPFAEIGLASAMPAMSNEVKDIVKEAMRFEKAVIMRDVPRFLQLLMTAIATCERVHAEALLLIEELKNDRRKRGVVTRQSNQAQDVRALFFVNLPRFVDSSKESYEQVFTVLQQVVLALPDERRTDENQTRNAILSTVVPARLGELASAAFSQWTRVFHDIGADKKVHAVLAPLLDGLVSATPLSAFNRRKFLAQAVNSLSSKLSQEGGKKSLYRVAFATPFKSQLLLLKMEAELGETINRFVPSFTDQQEEE